MTSEHSVDLDVVTSEELVQELCKRQDVAVVLTARKERDHGPIELPSGDFTWEIECTTEGPFFAYIGLAESFVSQQKSSLRWGDQEPE